MLPCLSANTCTSTCLRGGRGEEGEDVGKWEKGGGGGDVGKWEKGRRRGDMGIGNRRKGEREEGG